MRGAMSQLTSEQEHRYGELVAKSGAGIITTPEIEELHRLQAEVDGRDFASQFATGGGAPQQTKQPDPIDARLKRLDDSLASAVLKEAHAS